MNPTTKRAVICNLCEEQEDGPQCVKYCPKEALSLSTAEVVGQQARREVVQRLFEELLAQKE
jgi:Fe-S-cluster-containing hydrogenase component 2